MSFEKLNVNVDIIKILKEQGIIKPTKIQEIAIPLILSGKDVIGMSYTGSGKTVAFGIPIIENTKPGTGLKTLILAPTRELAVQIANELKKLSNYKRCYVTTVYGGVSLGPQIEQMAKADIVVATPGRLLDHLQRGNIDLSKINCFVLDEADKMVEMGFIEDIEQILSQTPRDKQVLLFGATISYEIDHLKKRYMNNPSVAEADKYVKQEFLEQFYYNIPHYQKFSLLVHLLQEEKTDRVMIFCSARSTVELLTTNLRKQGIKAEMIHGKMSQNKRLWVIDKFNKDKLKILVASAVAARGLDIRDITHVFNYDLSKDPQEYVHRIGRTARAGECGKAITLLSEKDYDTFNQIFDRYSLKIEELQPGKFAKLRFETRSRERFGFRGQRNNFREPRNFRGQGFRGRGPGGQNFGRKRSYGGHHSRETVRSAPRSREMTRTRKP